MLTKESYVAIDFFSPFINKIKGQSLKKLCTFFKQHVVDYSIIYSNEEYKTISYKSLQTERFIDEHLKKEITLLSTFKEVTIQSGNYTFHLQFYYDRQDNLNKVIDVLSYAISFTSQLSRHKLKDITIKYYLLNTKRVLDGDTFFDKEEVNGGACWSSPEECDITVWRKEEILKVTIHELIHGLSYDYKQDSNAIIQHYQSKYGITSPKMNTFEAYTEIFAELIHSYLLSRFIHTLYPNVSEYDLFSFMVSIEMEFSQMQSSKVLDLLQLNKDVNKETNVTSYYLIKTELYNDLPNFLNFCYDNNENIIKMNDTTKYFNYLKDVKAVVKKKYKTNNSYLQKTTRMTCLELDLF